MGPVRTPGSASASLLDFAPLPYRADDIEIADATDDAHKPLSSIFRIFMIICSDRKS